MIQYRTPLRVVFEVFLYLGLIVFTLCIITPFLHIAAISLSSRGAIMRNEVTILPVDLFTTAYRIILGSRLFLTSLENTVLLAVVNTGLTILVAIMAAYALANRHFVGIKVALMYIIIPMYFSGGLIPLPGGCCFLWP